MTETKDTTDKTLRGGARKPLSLQRTVESGHVRQNFSHGRSKSVVVEKRRTRKLAGPGGTETEVVAEAPVIETPAPRKPGRPRGCSRRRQVRGRGPARLSNEERDARARALAAARERDDVERVEDQDRAERATVVAAAAPPPHSGRSSRCQRSAGAARTGRAWTCIGTPTYRRRRPASAHVVQSCAAAA